MSLEREIRELICPAAIKLADKLMAAPIYKNKADQIIFTTKARSASGKHAVIVLSAEIYQLSEYDLEVPKNYGGNKYARKRAR
jgi:hypothetical protein